MMSARIAWALIGLATGCGGGGGPVDGHYDCLGEPGTPEVGDESQFTYTVKNPTDDAPFPGATVHVFPDNQVAPDCEPPCQALVADDDGLVDVTLPEGWFAYRVQGLPAGTKDRRVTTIEVNAVHPPDDEGFLNAVFEADMRAIFSFAAGKPDHDLGKAVARGVDCDETPVANLRPRVFGSDGEEVEDVVVAYLNKGEGFPGIGRSGTNQDGRAFLANLPDGEVRVELWGHDGDGEDERLGCEVLWIEAGATTTARIRPLRDDGHPACGLADPLTDVAQ